VVSIATSPRALEVEVEVDCRAGEAVSPANGDAVAGLNEVLATGRVGEPARLPGRLLPSSGLSATFSRGEKGSLMAVRDWTRAWGGRSATIYSSFLLERADLHTLYYAPGAASLVVHWLLIELDLPHELRRLDFAQREHKQPQYLSLNPAGMVPTLVIDGEPLCEAAALAMYLADAHPQAGLAPTGDGLDRARYLQWMLFMANTLQPAFRSWWYPHEPAGADQAEAVREAITPRIEAIWQRLDEHLAGAGPWLLGERLSAADFLLTMLMRWSRNMPRPATEWPALRRLADTIRSRPSFRQLYVAEALSEWALE
jgi:glutathione S-transferase